MMSFSSLLRDRCLPVGRQSFFWSKHMSLMFCNVQQPAFKCWKLKAVGEEGWGDGYVGIVISVFSAAQAWTINRGGAFNSSITSYLWCIRRGTTSTTSHKQNKSAVQTQELNKQLLWHVWLKDNKTGSKFSWRHISVRATSCRRSWDFTTAREKSEVKGQSWKGRTDLVPVAVVLGGMAVILQDLGDGALVDALQTKLPLPQLQETSTWKKGRHKKTEERHFIKDHKLNNCFAVVKQRLPVSFHLILESPPLFIKPQAKYEISLKQWRSYEEPLNFTLYITSALTFSSIQLKHLNFLDHKS